MDFSLSLSSYIPSNSFFDMNSVNPANLKIPRFGWLLMYYKIEIRLDEVP
jgi:hypothetical protein